eukprot:symbB.v1.2.032419.t1/scaffold3894.1/size54726/1
MVIAEAVAGAAAGAHALWEYNRDNFLYDRKMRQETELKILEWRAEQSELWRDDVRDIVGLTQRKMDSYLIVSTLLLGMCLGLFSEGRLQPGTPPFLIHYYMLTLSAAFMYLLMSVWLAVHASIVAQCSAVRLLTQFVRLPIPTWEALQNMRTFACNYEKLDAKDMMRVPFTRNPRASANSEPVLPGGSASSKSSATASGPIDPWRLEQHVEDWDLYELQHMPALRRRHVQLARHAARQYQSYDAFARVSMAFGTHQLMQSICYYCLGYVALQDGSPWASVGVLVLMCVMTISLVQLDFEMTSKEMAWAMILIIAGPSCAGAATYTWSVWGIHARFLVEVLLPLTYAAHGGWLFFALVKCGLETQPKTGVILPQRFRAVLYMDVFGVLKHNRWQEGGHSGHPAHRSQNTPSREQSRSLHELKHEIQANMKLFQSETVKGAMDDADSVPINLASLHTLAVHSHAKHQNLDMIAPPIRSFNIQYGMSFMGACTVYPSVSILIGIELTNWFTVQERQPRTKLQRMHQTFLDILCYTDFGTEVEYLYNPKSGEARPLDSEEDDIVSEMPSPGGMTKSSSTNGQKVRTMTQFDAAIEEYCEHQKHGKTEVVLPPEALQSTPSSILHHLKQAKVAVMTPVVNAVSAGLPEISEDETEEHSRDVLSPSGEMSSKDANFHPMTFINEHSNDEDTKVVSGHDKMDPGKLPAKVFSLATLLMVLLWAIGLAVPFGVFREFFTKPLMIDLTVGGSEKGGGEEIQAVVGTRPDGLPELIPMVSHRKDLHSVLKGHPIQVQWPLKAGLKPRTLSCDPSGRVLVVADDLGVYAGVLEEADVKRVRFDRVPPCVALEGQAVQDVSVACGTQQQVNCRVLVLHSKGRLLAECPLQESFAKQKDKGHMTVPALPHTEPEQWQIPDTWLHHNDGHSRRKLERIKALAANSACMMGAFQANAEGCVVAGTSEGRIVELRESHIKNHTLVPERAMEQRNEALSAGSLHFSAKGYVMVLRRKSRSVQAFDTLRGTSAGECAARKWRLPPHVNWLSLGGGGEKLFALGVHEGFCLSCALIRLLGSKPKHPEAKQSCMSSPCQTSFKWTWAMTTAEGLSLTSCDSRSMPLRMTPRMILVLHATHAIRNTQPQPGKHARCLWRPVPSCAVHRPMVGFLPSTSHPMVMAGVLFSWTALWTSHTSRPGVLGQHAKRFYPLSIQSLESPEDHGTSVN